MIASQESALPARLNGNPCRGWEVDPTFRPARETSAANRRLNTTAHPSPNQRLSRGNRDANTDDLVLAA